MATCPGPLTTPFPIGRGAITFWGGRVNGAFIRGGPPLMGGTAYLSGGNPPPLGENKWVGGGGGGDDDLSPGTPPSL